MARLRQELIRRPFTRTVHAPHWPWSHPFFDPVSCKCSRSASSNVVRGSISSGCVRPLILRVTFAGVTAVSDVLSAAAIDPNPIKLGPSVIAAPVPPTCLRKRRRVSGLPKINRSSSPPVGSIAASSAGSIGSGSSSFTVLNSLALYPLDAPTQNLSDDDQLQ